MKTPRLLAASLALLLSGVAYAGSIIPNSIFIPDSEVLIDFNGTGLDWVYAGPIAPNEFGLGNIEVPSYRAAEGWRYASAAEWLLRPDWDDFIRPSFSVPAVSGWTDHSKYIFASEYWGYFYHVDINDYADGRVTNGFDIGSLSGVYETIYVRDSQAPSNVPDAGATALYCALALVGCVGLRRRLAS